MFNLALYLPCYLPFPTFSNPQQMLVQTTKGQTDEVKKYRRTWTREQVADLVQRTEAYAEAKSRPKESLDVLDFQIVADGLPQTPAQCYAKIQEVFANGTLRPGVWCEDEDRQLKKIVSQGIIKWSKIAKAMNLLRYQGKKVRTGKQCKERWTNHLDPDIKHGNWTAADDLNLLELYISLGKQWSKITQLVKNRTVSSIKNRFKSLINKEIQSISRVQSHDEVIHKLIHKLRQEVGCDTPIKKAKAI